MDDVGFMQAAIDAGTNVAGNTGENPAVGCVVVHEGRIVATGATQPPGGDHAEVCAIHEAEAAGHDLSTCDIFVTLEPCSFQGHTPPCAALLIEKRPRRVVVGIQDPHPRVRGAGIAALRNAGIEVELGVLSGPVESCLSSWIKKYSASA